jgi:uncharacterized protein
MVMPSSSNPPSMIARRSAPLIAAALKDTRVALVAGPRQSGKTTLVRQFVTKTRPYITLDDQGTLSAAKADPTGFIRELPSAVIDEVQRAPELMLALKVAVDNDPTPGRFLLTGSANVMALPTIGDSLAGRVEVITLLPLAQSEIEGSGGNFIDSLFAGDRTLLDEAAARAVIDQELRSRILAGGYPEALARAPSRRSRWHENHLSLILDRDVRDIASIEQLDALPGLLDMLAAQAGQLTNISNIANALQLSRLTVSRYVEILERLFLVRQITPWYSKRVSRLIKTPEVQFFDSGLLASRLQVDGAGLQAAPAQWGALFETFVFAELMKLASFSETRPTISHFRTKQQDEVDFVLENRRGQIIGIKVKSAATLRRQDSSGLRKLQEATGDKFLLGLILHNHDQITPIGERILAAPISALWSG